MRVSSRFFSWPAVLILLSTALVALPARAAITTIATTVTATVETEPVPHSGDSADDPAIWIHPTDPAQSTFIGTDKHGGLAVYDLAGIQLQYLPDGDLNNVDLRDGFPLSEHAVTLVTAGNRSNDSLAMYRVDPATRRLESVAARTIRTLPVYGSCMYHSAVTGRFYTFVNSEAGDVEQWELFATPGNRVDARKVRSFAVGSQTEGCVADDTAGALYIAEEAVGIWKYRAEPDAGTARTKVDSAGGGHLVADIEGLTIADTGNGAGYVIASSQGDNSYAVYTRTGNNAYLGSFRIVDGKGIDGTSDTDGIDVTTANLGPAFPRGAFVAQDGSNDGGRQNFKLVPLDQIIKPADTSSPPPTAPPTQRPSRTPTPDTGATAVPSPTPPSSPTCSALPIRTVQASGDDGNAPANVLDNDLTTRWSNQGNESWITADLGSLQDVCTIGIAWYQGDTRVNHFVVQGSSDNARYVDLLSSDSSGKRGEIETYAIAPTPARYVRVVVHGNTHNDWASITELRINSTNGSPPAPTAAPTAVPAPTAPPHTPPPGTSGGIWISAAELARLPVSGGAWSRLKSAADGDLGTPNISDQNSQHDTNTLAAALVYARTGDSRYRSKAAEAIRAAIGTERGGRTLALGRNLVSYVIAADLIDLQRYDAGIDQQFRSWLAAVRNETLDGKTLISTHEVRPNNWGTHAGASRVAADRYLGDTADLARAAQVFKGWLGDRAAYAGFTYGQLEWQADASKPVGINPKGATKNGRTVDGVLPDDQRRAGGFTWPPQKENYVWEGLQGALVQAELLHRAGYDAWGWSDKALLRAVTWETIIAKFPAQSDDTWQIWLVNHAYGTTFPTSAANNGKNMGFTDWLYGR